MFSILLQISVIFAAATASLAPTIELNDGNHIPVVAFGTFGRVKEVYRIKPAVIHAIETGYRHIDTAAIYRNEEQVGEAIAEVINRGIVKREDLWITTKISPSITTREDVVPAIKESLQKLKLDYVDLYLIHYPSFSNTSNHDYLNVWQGLEDVQKLNLTRSIGVSNFNKDHIDQVLAISNTVPSINQIEVHPFYNNLEVVQYSQSLNITIMSYANFGFMVPRPWLEEVPYQTLEEPILRQLARKYEKLPSQIALRYLLDRGTIAIPRSTNTKHIEINIDILDFELTEEEIKLINELRQEDKVYSFDPEILPAFNDYFGLN
ncbi:aldo-keto reductase AKR2E4-like [Melitaea cinxia]|uniref:aldo-keto reductase AKR2E4-like n=1 Tax=Melitaea cinxia TaxID=113334 RepID=UPI001E274C20|nr:aldo-keto reductase AKR2E4-like [Melitaea cinxia]